METEQILKLLRSIIDEVVSRDKRPVSLPNKELIFRFELHVVELVGLNENITVNELAKKMNVTKGAISQIITKLEKKDIVQRLKNNNNKKIVELALTLKGEKIFEGHKNFHSRINNKISEGFCMYSEDELQLIYDALSKIKNLLVE